MLTMIFAIITIVTPNRTMLNIIVARLIIMVAVLVMSLALVRRIPIMCDIGSNNDTDTVNHRAFMFLNMMIVLLVNARICDNNNH